MRWGRPACVTAIVRSAQQIQKQNKALATRSKGEVTEDHLGSIESECQSRQKIPRADMNGSDVSKRNRKKEKDIKGTESREGINLLIAFDTTDLGIALGLGK